MGNAKSKQTNSNDMGAPTCDCDLVPCSLDSLIIGCDHGEARTTIISPDNNSSIALVAKENNPTKHTLKAKAQKGENSECSDPSNCPKLVLYKMNGASTEELTRSVTNISYELEIEETASALSTLPNLAKFAKITWGALFGDLKELADSSYLLKAINHDNKVEECVNVNFYPHINWTATNFGFSMSKKFSLFDMLDGDFTPTISGKIEGRYGIDKIEFGGTFNLNTADQADDIFPGVSRIVDGLLALHGESSNKSDPFSYFQIESKLGSLNGNYTMEEHPNKPSEVGFSSNLDVGFDPLLGVEIKVDIGDVFLPQLNKARQILADGMGFDNLNFAISVEAYLSIDGKLMSGGAKFIKEIDADLDANVDFSGTVKFELGASIIIDAEVYIIDVTFDASLVANATLICGIKSVNSGVENGKNLQVSMGHNGVYGILKGKAQVGYGVVSLGPDMELKLEALQPNPDWVHANI